MTRAKTPEQSKIMKFIEKNFKTNYLNISLLSKNNVLITDRDGEWADFYYVDGKVVMYDKFGKVV